jgi:adenylate cyclase
VSALDLPMRLQCDFGGSGNTRLGGLAHRAPPPNGCASRLPNVQWPRLWLASAYAQLGQLEEARAEAAEVLRINPGFTIQRYKRLLVFKHPEDAEHRVDGLRKAGLPED